MWVSFSLIIITITIIITIVFLLFIFQNTGCIQDEVV